MGGQYIGLPGGSISIATVGKMPDVMNPLSYGGNSSDNLVFRFLFRSLISYDPENGTFSGDLANCDISKLQQIECLLKDNNTWSDGTSVQSGDIIATFDAFRENAIDPKMLSFLKGVAISEQDKKIVITSKTKSPLMMDLLLYPIIRSDMIEQLKTGRFSTGLYITSGLYKFGEIAQDAEYGFDRITLLENNSSSLPGAWLDKIHFKYFPDNLTLERGLETVSIIIPPGRNLNITLTGRFKEYNYTGYEFFGVFFHTDRLPTNLRNSLHWQLGTLLSGSIDASHKKIDNFFPNVGNTLPSKSLGNFPDILRKNGYVKKDELISMIDTEPLAVTGGIKYDSPKYFENRENSIVLFGEMPEKEKGIVLYGNVPETTVSVRVNDYTLQEYRVGNTEFAYKISEARGSLREGENTYALELNDGTSTKIVETLTYYFSSNSGTLNGYKEVVNSGYLARINTPAFLADKQRKKDERKAKIAPLDDRYYYNASGEPFSLKVAYINGPQGTEIYAQEIEKILKDLGVFTELIAYKSSDIEELIKSGKKDYDMLVLGIETPGNIGHIGQMFLSSEAGVGVNFSNIESTKLDELFINLRTATETGSVTTITEEITHFMREESFFLPISSPMKSIFIDRNLKGIKTLNIIPDSSYFYPMFNYVSIKDSYILNMKNKGVLNFFSWIIDTAL
ncbi:hypothetical protein KBD33_02350 [Candidatus Gracilibacteria bacterium]|nr:hypothetical protein [Candidatus Gracilibacteria bacterium]